MKNKKKNLKGKIDWLSTLIPLFGIAVLCVIFMAWPEQSAMVLEAIRSFLGDECGIYYALLGVGIFGCTLYMAFSKYGKIKLGGDEKPQYSSFRWGVMIFTSTMAADILFYSLCEWALYANEPHIENLGGIQKWASTYPLFHWGPIAWSFYIVLAVAFGFMLHVRGREKQKFSEACRPVLGKRVDGFWGKVIDLTAIFALLAGTATTFSLATPLLSAAFGRVFGIGSSTGLTIGILLVIAAVYTLTVWFGMKGISKLAAGCSYLFFALLAYVLLAGGETTYILETGFSAVGNLIQNFVGMATWMDPLRETSFPQNWTVYYWAYWMVWCVATPFFIGKISKGRTVRNVVLGGYGWGLAGTFTSFIILGNYGMAQQLKHGVDISGFLAEGGAYAEAILRIFETLPLPKLGLLLLAVTMIAFYSTTFDALTMVISSYSYKRLPEAEEPDKRVRTFWAVLFILLPIALIFAENSMYSLQSVAIIAAFPVGILIVLIVAGFFRDAKNYLEMVEKGRKPGQKGQRNGREGKCG
ncbi:MAG: BCCT family transporter [Eubacteriales bacterium]|nr:BCCT family transporter [Eubacteriales bacterium]